MTLTSEKITELKQKHSELHKITIADEVFVMRPPSRAEWQRFEMERADTHKRAVARENLVRSTVVFPDVAVLESTLDRKPAMIIPLVDKACELAGFVEKVHDEKL